MGILPECCVGMQKVQYPHIYFFLQVEALDFALRSKDQATAINKLASTKTALDNVIAAF